jgi:hypothetical protein
MTTPSKLIIPVVALSLLLVTALLRAQPNSAGAQPGRYQLVSATYGDYHTPEYSKPIGDGTKGTRRPYVEEMLLRPEYQAKIAEAIRFNTDYSKTLWYADLVLKYEHRPTWDEQIKRSAPFPVQSVFKIDTATGKVWQFVSVLDDSTATLHQSWRELPD